ncbi:uncharacterized protein HKW66_Vig0233880 [Vigna angularis]|uniref:Uncharacterized protein n=1 Tax=Phaseolus angularis TaxID=3914 RepID=A0A8T0KSU0_PHAAN|nr:uncharacterized protein HKW66_Vig0233880 [Vigna angularis]
MDYGHFPPFNLSMLSISPHLFPPFNTVSFSIQRRPFPSPPAICHHHLPSILLHQPCIRHFVAPATITHPGVVAPPSLFRQEYNWNFKNYGSTERKHRGAGRNKQKAKPIRPAPIVASPNTKKQKVVVTSDTSPTCEEHVKKNIPLEVVDLIVSEVSEEPTGEILGGVDLSGALVQVTKLLLGDTFSSGVPLPPNLSLGGLPRLSYRGSRVVGEGRSRRLHGAEVMMTQCMTIMRYCKSYMVKRSLWMARGGQKKEGRVLSQLERK